MPSYIVAYLLGQSCVSKAAARDDSDSTLFRPIYRFFPEIRVFIQNGYGKLWGEGF